MLVVVLFLIFFTVFLFGFAIVPMISSRLVVFSDQRQQKISGTMEQFMPRPEAKKKSRLLVLAPLVTATVMFLVTPEELRVFGVIVGIGLGLIFPSMYIRVQTKQIRDKFSDQLVDALMIMSSSFRGGLSLVQALEAVVEEMPDPIRKEFGMVLGENKMGVTLEEAMHHLYKRMPSVAVQQMITAILLARETGGNLPLIFSRIVDNIRQNKKIQQNLDTLTIQGKIQGVVMSFLPIGFLMIVYNANKRIFDHMLHSEVGKTLLMVAAGLWLCGVFFIWKISTFKDF